MSGDVFIKFRYEERDIRRALRLRLVRTLRGRLDILVATGLCGALCVAGMVVTSGVVRMGIAGFVVLALVIVFAMLVVVPKIMFQRRKSRWATTIDASDEGITVTSGPTARTIVWDDCVVEMDSRICVIEHGEDVLLVPRRAFRNEGRERVFLELVERHTSRESRRSDSGKSTPSAKA